MTTTAASAKLLSGFDDPAASADEWQRVADAGPDDLVVIGGGLFMDYFEPFWRAFAPLAERVPFCGWGAGCCDMKLAASRPALPLVGPIAARGRPCVVRDESARRDNRSVAEAIRRQV